MIYLSQHAKAVTKSTTLLITNGECRNGSILQGSDAMTTRNPYLLPARAIAQHRLSQPPNS